MKKLFFFAFMTIYSAGVYSQSLGLNAYGGYVFKDAYDSYYDANNYYSGTVDDGFQWGAGVEYMIKPQLCIELMYLRHSTNGLTTYQAGAGEALKTTDFTMVLNYVLLATEGHFANFSRTVEVYIGALGGTMTAYIRNPDNANEGFITKFAWGVRLGCNLLGRRRFGVKIQGQVLSSAQAMGGEVYFGTYGTAVGLASYSNIYQFSLGGGVTYRFGK